MFRRLDILKRRLKDELAEELNIGISIHPGEAIVGPMGAPSSPIVSTLGDNVNITARLEAQTKEFSVPLIILTTVAARRGVDMDIID